VVMTKVKYLINRGTWYYAQVVADHKDKAVHLVLCWLRLFESIYIWVHAEVWT